MSRSTGQNDQFAAREREQPEFPDYACVCYGPDTACQCSRTERALRTIAMGQGDAMTPAQRDYCRKEIVKVEGYSDKDAQGSDAQVALATLDAWRDYSRDQGLL